MDLLQGEHPEIFAGIRVGHGKKLLLAAYKSSNISETGQDGTKVTIEDQYEVPYALSIGAKSTILDDLEGSLCPLSQNTCDMVLVVIFIFTFNLILVNK